MKQTELSFFPIIKLVAAHWDLLTLLRTPSLQNLLTSNLRVLMYILGIGKALAWYGLVLSLSSSLTLEPFHVPREPSNSVEYLVNKFRSLLFWCLAPSIPDKVSSGLLAHIWH